MRTFIILSLILAIATATSAFTSSAYRGNKVKRALIGSHSRRTPTLLSAAAGGAAKKKAAKKKKATKKKKTISKKGDTAEKEEVVTFRKPEFITRVAEKTGMSKADSEAALAAVLETITEVGADSLRL